MIKIKFALVFLIVLAVNNCAMMAITTDFNLRDKNEIYNKIVVKYDNFRNQIIYIAPAIKIGNIRNNKIWFFRGFKIKGLPAITHIYVAIKYYSNGWKNFKNAASNGEIIPTRIISRHVISCVGHNCNYREELAISISLNKLKTFLNEYGVVNIGIKDQYGQNWVIDLTNEYILAFEKKLNENK